MAQDAGAVLAGALLLGLAEQLSHGAAGPPAHGGHAGMGISPPLRLRHAAAMMGAGGHERQPGWLEVVLSWPHRIIRPAPALEPLQART